MRIKVTTDELATKTRKPICVTISRSKNINVAGFEIPDTFCFVIDLNELLSELNRKEIENVWFETSETDTYYYIYL